MVVFTNVLVPLLRINKKKVTNLFNKRSTLSLFVFILSLTCAFGQVPAKKTKSYLQLSGVVLDQDSLTPIPFVSIMVNEKGKAVSDYYGFFTVVVSAGDVVQFLSASHKNRFYKVDDTCSLKHYYAIQVLTKDTMIL